MLEEYPEHVITHHCGTDPKVRSNAAVLIGAYQLIVLERELKTVLSGFFGLPKFLPFCDVSEHESSYECTVEDVLRGLARAMKLGWFDYSQFNLLEYEVRSRMDRGDFNWIVPGKLLALSSPYCRMVDPTGLRVYTPEDY
jgi:cell division cycle 14